MELKTVPLYAGIDLHTLHDSRHVSNRLSINLCVPLQADTVTPYALLGEILGRSSQKYPTFAALNRRLYDLYGSFYDCRVSSLGDCQVLTLMVQGIDDRFCLEKEPLLTQLADFLCDMLLCPCADQNGFDAQLVEVEKKNQRDEIAAQLNNKRAWALQRAREQVFCGQPAAIPRLGWAETLDAITPASLYGSYRRLLREASIHIIVSGSGALSQVEEPLRRRLSAITADRRPLSICHHSVPTAPEKTEQLEEMQMNQTKLVFCLAPCPPFTAQQYGAVRVAMALLGSTPFSRLFVNVREKESLCYYCDGRYNRLNGLTTIDLGLDYKDCARAEKAVMEQIQALQAGDFSDSEIEDTKKYLLGGFASMGDSLGELDPWYLAQIIEGRCQSPEQAADQVRRATREEMVTVYRSLKPILRYTLAEEQHPEKE
ncbi:Peptidase M16 inactive domain [Anaerotruncus sp. 2789STDY5834896]|uniref:Peptidase M16 inactive domain n=1 Tax=uncultured Anaerotruncus sp. TaxID=905011 RepID=A0A1C6I1L2_9FIRM|nr:Peptidase M16 inactive domain [uncultured Anaerotruncus sp.]